MPPVVAYPPSPLLPPTFIASPLIPPPPRPARVHANCTHSPPHDPTQSLVSLPAPHYSLSSTGTARLHPPTSLLYWHCPPPSTHVTTRFPLSLQLALTTITPPRTVPPRERAVQGWQGRGVGGREVGVGGTHARRLGVRARASPEHASRLCRLAHRLWQLLGGLLHDLLLAVIVGGNLNLRDPGRAGRGGVGCVCGCGWVGRCGAMCAG